MSRMTLANRIVATLLPLSWLLSGCCTLSWRQPSDDRIVAAREEGCLGLESLNKGRLKEAELRLKNSLKRCPLDFKVRHDFANVLWQLGDRDKAIEEMDRAIEGSGGDPSWLVEMGNMYLEAGQEGAALQIVDQALAADSNLGIAWKLRGDVMKRRQDHEAARNDYYRALSCNSQDVDALRDLAEIYRLQHRPRRALATLERISDTIPPDQRPVNLPYLKAIAYQAMGRHEEALPLFQATLLSDGEQPALLLQMARSQLALGLRKEARSAAMIVARTHPQDPHVREILTATESPTRLASGP